MPVSKSRLGLARPAVRPAMWGRVMISGPSGSGKTWTSIALAETLVPPTSRILVVDTEKESALSYADEFVRDDGSPIFEHLAWAPPYDPDQLTDTLRDAGELYDCVTVDSFTHWWRGAGGILDIANGRFTGWADARPKQVDLVEAILRCDAHVILCVREKQAHEQVQENGTWVVKKLGLEPIQDADLEYEMNVSLQMDMQHTLAVSKSRTAAVPVGTTFHAGHAQDFAVIYRDWLAAGEPVVSHADSARLVDTINRIEVEAERVKAKRLFVDTFGRPEFMLQSRWEEAAAWVADVVVAANGGEVLGAATAGADEAGEPEPASERGAAYDEIAVRVAGMKIGEVRNELGKMQVRHRDETDDDARALLIEEIYETTPREPVPDVDPEAVPPDAVPDTAPVGPSPEPGSETPAEAPAAQSDEQGPGSDETEPETSIPSEVIDEIEAAVKALTLSKVRQELENRQAQIAGTPQQLRGRLVDRLLSEWLNLEAEKRETAGASS